MHTNLHRRLIIAGLVVVCVAGCAKGRPDAGVGAPAAASPEAATGAKRAPRFPKPDNVRGIYLTAWKAGEPKMLGKVLALIDRTELNALVIDVRDAGHVYFKGDIPLAKEAGAMTVAVVRPDKLFARLEEAKVYPIARVACFRDNFVPKKRPDRAVLTQNGKPWKDASGHTWLDPYNRKNWEYIAAVVDLALDVGFAEIQLDYVRFPSEGKASTQVFPSKAAYPDAKASPTDVVVAFARFIGQRVRARNAVFSADIFGIVSSSASDQGIGQELETVAEPFDVICPMVYPSHFARGEYGIKDPNASPHAIVRRSLGDYARRLPRKAIRPWLQDFSLGVPYGRAEVRAQIKAAREMGYGEYLLWNPLGRYTEGGVKDNSDLPLATPLKVP